MNESALQSRDHKDYRLQSKSHQHFHTIKFEAAQSIKSSDSQFD